MDSNACRQAGMCGSRSWMLLLRARITRTAILRPIRFCWCCIPLSTVRRTSNPACSAKVNSSPFVFPAKPAVGTVWQSCPVREFFILLGRHSSIKTRTAASRGPIVCPLRELQWPSRGRRLGNRPGSHPVYGDRLRGNRVAPGMGLASHERPVLRPGSLVSA
jgi:hypothetical protein